MRDPVLIRRLGSADLGLLGELDRSEHMRCRYTVADDRLIAHPCDVQVPKWDPVGAGEHSVAHLVEFATPVVDHGGHVLGAFVADRVAGIAIVQPSLDAGRSWLALLHVDRSHRRHGVASLLWSHCSALARAAGASTLYVSATPSDSAVGFYLSRGCRLATRDELHEGLYALEPDDIHLVVDLGVG